jgi:hypothetical protein
MSSVCFAPESYIPATPYFPYRISFFNLPSISFHQSVSPIYFTNLFHQSISFNLSSIFFHQSHINPLNLFPQSPQSPQPSLNLPSTFPQPSLNLPSIYFLQSPQSFSFNLFYQSQFNPLNLLNLPQSPLNLFPSICFFHLSLHPH